MSKELSLVRTAKNVRYIKLGGGNEHFEESVNRGIAWLGFWLERDEYLNAFKRKDRAAIKRLYSRDPAKHLHPDGDVEVLTRGAANVAGQLLAANTESEGSTIWITFADGQMWWGVSEETAKWAKDVFLGRGIFLPLVTGWKSSSLPVDKKSPSESLRINALSGKLTKIIRFQGTVCRVKEVEYVRRRILGGVDPSAQAAIAAHDDLRDKLKPLIRSLNFKDFELLVELIFASSGWKRVSVSGKTMKDIDLELRLPSTGETALVQVKSSTSKREFLRYQDILAKWPGYQKFFWVAHSQNNAAEDSSPIVPEDYGNVSVIVWDVNKLAEHSIDAGLSRWLIDKVQ